MMNGWRKLSKRKYKYKTSQSSRHKRIELWAYQYTKEFNQKIKKNLQFMYNNKIDQQNYYCFTVFIFIVAIFDNFLINFAQRTSYQQNIKQIQMSGKIFLKSNARILSPKHNEIRALHISLNSTLDKKDMSCTRSQINIAQQNVSSFSKFELKQVDQAEQSQNIRDISRKVSNQQIILDDLQKESPKRNQYINLLSQQAKLIELSEKLRSLHGLYKFRINQVSISNKQKVQVIMSVLDELQKNHSNKIQQYKQILSRHYIGSSQSINKKLIDLKQNMEQIIDQTEKTKRQNERITALLENKLKSNKQKQLYRSQLKQQSYQLKMQLEKLELLQLKKNKKYKQMLKIIEKIDF